MFCLILCLRKECKFNSVTVLTHFLFDFVIFDFLKRPCLGFLLWEKTVKVIFKKFLCVSENVSLAEPFHF